MSGAFPNTARTNERPALTPELQLDLPLAVKSANRCRAGVSKRTMPPPLNKARPHYRAPLFPPEPPRTPNTAQLKDAPKTPAFPPFL